MASRLRKWILFVGVGCTLMTLWLVPPQPWIFSTWNFRRSSWRITPERIEAIRIMNEASRTNAVLQRLRMVDSLGTFVVEAPVSVGRVVVSLPDEVQEETAEKIRSAVQTEVDYVGTPNPEVAIGLMMVERTYSYRFSMGRDYNAGSEYYAGVAEERPFCFVVRPYNDQRVDGPESQRVAAVWSFGAAGYPTDALGSCGFYLAHGPPGPAIASWLRDGGASLLTDSRWMDERPPFTVLDHRLPFGVWRLNRSTLGSTAGEGCLGGRVEACRRALTVPESDLGNLGVVSDLSVPRVLAEIPEWIHSDSYGWRRAAFSGAEAWWMGDLESEFGRERFGRFWRSEQSVDDAFLAAFGEPIESWTMRWAQERMGFHKAGPSTDGLSVLLTMLTLLGCVGIAVTTGARRRV